MHLNGVILVSPTGLGITRGDEVASANIIAYYTATAWYHNKLAAELQQRDLRDLLPEGEEYAIYVLLCVLAKGAFMDSDTKQRVTSQISRYSGISDEVIL